MEERPNKISYEIDLANYYAVEILDSIFGEQKPSNEAIEALENKLKSCSFKITPPHAVPKKIPARALIVSSNYIEQNTLKLMLANLHVRVKQIRTKQDLLHLNVKELNFSWIIVSDHFKDLGFNLLLNYLQPYAKNSPKLIYLGNQFLEELSRIGFDAHLAPPFFMKDLRKILSNPSKK